MAVKPSSKLTSAAATSQTPSSGAVPLAFRGHRIGGGDRQRQVDVVHHQVEHRRDVAAAVRRRAVAQGLQSQRLLGDVEQAHGPEHHPLLVAAGDDQALGGGQGAHPLGVGDARGDRLLDIDRLAGRQDRQRLFGVEARGRGHGHHVHRVQERVQVVEAAPAQRHGDPRRRGPDAVSSTPRAPRRAASRTGAHGSRRTRPRRSRRPAKTVT